MLFILSAVKKDHKECVILLIATFTLLLQAFYIFKGWGLFETNKRSIVFFCWKDIIQPTNGLFGHVRPCVRVHLLFCHYKAARPHYIDHKEGWQYIECEKLDEKRKLLIYEVFISRHKGPFRIFCNLIGLFGVHFIAGGSMPLSFTLSYNITLIPLPWVFL